ncbi:MAG: class I SAM-dependent methyltransferase [Gemmatimonadales bacterium]
MDVRYAAAYGGLARSHWWWIARDRMVLRTVAVLMPGDRRGRVLDIGCGDGRLLDLLADGADVVGIESDAATISPLVPGRYPIHLAPFAAPLPIEGPFDIVLMLDVLEHLADPVAALRLARSLLAPGGSLVITVPALPALWTSHDDLNHHFRRYTRDSLDHELRDAGLGIVSARYFFHALGLAKLGVRAFERSREAAPRLPQVPPRFVNAIARAYSMFEYRVTAPFARLLPGSSLMAVASNAA